MEAYRIVKPVTGFEVGAIHDASEFLELERLVSKGCLEPLDKLRVANSQSSSNSPDVAMLMDEVESLSKRAGAAEERADKLAADLAKVEAEADKAVKDRDDWKAKADKLAADLEPITANPGPTPTPAPAPSANGSARSKK